MILDMRSWVLALILCACGDVNKAPPDAPSTDAYQPDAPASCGGGEMLCAGACANVMTSDQHCGSCDTQCAPNQARSSGMCVAVGIDCARIKLLNPAAAEGVYTNPNNGVQFYCNMTTTPPTTYYELGFGQFNTTYAGFTTIT